VERQIHKLQRRGLAQGIVQMLHVALRLIDVIRSGAKYSSLTSVDWQPPMT